MKQRAAQQEAEDEEKKRALEEHIKEEKEAHPEKTEEEILKETAERENETKQARIEADPSAEADEAFEGGKCVRVEDPQNGNLLCKLGLVRLADLKILPQFKFGANKETGEVNPLTAPKFLPDADPIRVWRRRDGEMYIASGRHRAALARRTGVDKIMAFVYDEDDVHTEKWARRFDIELNIRDNQATALECALFARGYFSEDGQPLSEEQVRVLGMDRKGSIGAIGLMIGREAGEDVMSAFRSGDISEQAAHAIVKFAPLSVPGNERVQQAGLRELLELGTNHIDEARIAMTVERGKNMMRAEAVGATQTNLFGETEDSEAWTKFIKDYIKQKLDYQRAFVRFLSDIGTKKTSEAVRKRFESHLKSTDPQEIKKQLREERQVLEMWRNPFDHPELRQEMTEAWNRKQGVKGETATDVSTTYSVGREYRVEDDRVGLGKHLGEVVEPVEIKYNGDIKADKAAYEAARGKKLSDVAYYREAITDALLGLAEKYPDGMEIGKTGYRVMLPQTRGRAKRAQGRARNSRKMEAVRGLEEVIRRGVHLGSTEPQERVGTGKRKKGMVATVSSFERFGYPVRLNGEEMLFWFNGTTDEPRDKKIAFYEFGVTDVQREAGEWSRAKAASTSSSQSPAAGASLGEFLSRVKDKNVVDVKKVGGGDSSTTFSVDKARERGLMKEGVLRVGNAVVTEPGVTFSVEGAQHASPHLFREFDTKFMGSGEGNQAFGWGLYFSTNWRVNKSYWEKFTGRNKKVTTNFGYSKTGKWDRDLYGELADVFVDRMGIGREDEKIYAYTKMGEMVRWGRYEEEIEAAKRRLEDAKNRLMERMEKRRSIRRAELDLALLEFLERNEVKEEEEENAVDYLVDLEVEEGELMEWGETASEAGWWNEEVEEELREIIRNRVLEDRGRTEEQKERFVEYEMETMRLRSGRSFYEWLAEWLGQREASEWLLAHGVKGIRYEDYPSRGREEKTYNYVVFDGRDVKIRKINNRGEWTSDVGAEPWKRAEEVDFGTTFSVAGEKSRLWGANIERAFRDPRDGRMKYVIPLDGVRIKENVTAGMLSVPSGGHKDVALRDVLDYEGLYEAYPELRDMRLRLYHDGGEGFRGFFRKKGKEAACIHLNVGKTEGLSGEEMRGKFLRTLLHEAQHAIQTVEGWGFGFVPGRSKEEVLNHLEEALTQRIGVGMETEKEGTAWQKANLKYLYDLKERVHGTKEWTPEWGKLAEEVAWVTSGEQEARWVQNGQQGELVPGNAETITRAYAAQDLGGVTFEGLPNEVDRGLVPQGDFLVDRRVFQMKEAVARRMEALWRLMNGGKAELPVELAKEAGDIVREVERLLPQSYGFALEPYKIFFDSYAMLRGSGSAEEAGSLVPMGDWAAKMTDSYMKVTELLMRGRLRRDLAEFYDGLTEGEKAFLTAAQEKWKEFEKVAREEEKENARRQQRKVDRQKILRETFQKMVEAYPDVDVKINKIQAKLRMDKLMAAFLKRVGMQLTAYRKDRVLGKIRRAIDALTPAPGKDGKPVKGRMNAEDYKKLTDLVRLMEMTKGERDKFEQEHFTDDKGVAVWDDKPVDEKVAVTTYDNEGKEVTLEVTKGEFDTYACFDGMTAEQAERMAAALGEFIRTGRQAWDNAELAQRQKIGGWCRAAIDAYGETAGEKKTRRQKEQRAMGALKKKFLAMTDAAMNDAQFFDAISSVPEMREWTGGLPCPFATRFLRRMGGGVTK